MNKSIYAITIIIALFSCSDKTVPPNSEIDNSQQQQIINNQSSNDIKIKTFDTTQISTEKCRDDKLIEKIIQFSKEEPYDYYNSGAINQYYKCSEFPKTELQKFPLLRKKNKGIDSIAIHMDVSNATIWLISNTFENHKILQEEMNACGFGGVSGYWYNSKKKILTILMYVTRNDFGCASGKPPCVRTYFSKEIDINMLYDSKQD
jgi:hypothetical protein